jgi:Na+/proline symporter
MIHLALILLALYVIVRVGLGILEFVAEMFDSSFVAGCVSLVGVVFVILVIAVLAL